MAGLLKIRNNETMRLPFYLSPTRRIRLNEEVHRIFSPGLKTAINATADELPEWIQLAPYGEWPTSERGADGKPEAVQIFTREDATALVKRFNAWHRRLARLARLNSCKAYVGHPDFAPDIWPERNLLADVIELQDDEHGLNARMAWDAAKTAAVRKNCYPSVAWDTEVISEGQERPIMLWSVGMTSRPNIKGVKSVINALPETIPDPEPNEPNMKLLEQIKALLIKSGLLKETDPEESILSGISSLISSAEGKASQEKENDEMYSVVKTALNAEGSASLGSLVKRLATEYASLTAGNAERETRLNALTSERDAERTERINAILERLIETGRITKAEEEVTRTRLNADPVKGLEELLKSPAKLGGKSLDIGRTRPAIADLQDRMTRINAWTEKHMAEKKVGYDEAFKAAQSDPELKPLFEAMKPAAE